MLFYKRNNIYVISMNKILYSRINRIPHRPSHNVSHQNLPYPILSQPGSRYTRRLQPQKKKLISNNKVNIQPKSQSLIVKKDISTMNRKTICVICQEPLKKTNLIILKCGHLFCASCIFKCLNYTRKCPLCRHKITWTIPYIKKYK